MSEEKSAFATLDGLMSFMASDEIDGHPVKEWTTTQFQALYPYLSGVTESLAKSGATFSNLKTYLAENWHQLVDAVMPHMVPIILISCPTVTQEYLDKEPFTRGLEFIMLILRKNIEHVADFFGLKAGLLESPAEGEEAATIEPTKKSSTPK